MKINVKDHKQRFLSLLLAIVMVVGLLPVVGVKAADYEINDTNYSTLFAPGSKVKGGVDSIINNTGKSKVNYNYYDVDGTSLMHNDSTGAGGTHKILTYGDANAASKYLKAQLTGAYISDLWKVEVDSSGIAATGAGTIVIYLTALPALYDLTWAFPGDATVTLADGSTLPTSFTLGQTAIDLSPANFSATRTGYKFAGWKVGTTSVGQSDDKIKDINDITAPQLDLYDSATAQNCKIRLTAQWTENTYAITFDNNIPASENTPSKDIADLTGVTYNDPITADYYTVGLPAAPVKNDATGNAYDHYDFTGWSVDISPVPLAGPNQYNGTVKMDKLIKDLGADNSIIPMVANWTGKLYYLNYNLSAGAAAPTSGVTVPTQSPRKEYGKDSFDIETMSDTTDYKFKGWSFDAKGATNNIDLTPGTQTVKDVRDLYETTIGSTAYGTGSIDVYGVWNPVYIITWVDGDGNPLGTTSAEKGETPAYSLPATPTKTATGGAIYLFNNTWTPAITPATGNTTYTANFTQTIKNYTITWKDGDGNTLETSTVAYGTVPAYTLAATPTKKADATNTYTFSNSWSPALTAVTGDATYTAQFTATPIATSPSPAAPVSPSPAAPVSPSPAAPVTPAPTAPVTPTPTETVTPTPAEVKAKFYDIEYYEEINGEEVRLKKTANPDTYEYGVGAEIKYGLDKEGYTFEGWYSKKSNKYVTKIGKKTKGTVKLYAIFTPVDEGSKDEGNNGSGQPASEFGVLCVRLIDYTENSMTLTWNLLDDVDGYDIFGSRCNSKDVIRAYEPIDTVGADVNEYLADNLLAQTYYKFYVRAFILVNGEKRYITTSINVHGVTLNDTYGVADEINIDKVVLKYANGKSKTKYNREKDEDAEEINITMKVGQTLKIVTSEYSKDGKEIRAHRPISFESSKPEICKIGKKSSHKYGVEVKGKANTYKSRTITAKAEGECTIYVFAQNGLYTKINVTVKK